MVRVKRGVAARRRHSAKLHMAKGYWGTRSRLYRRANEAVMKALSYQYRDRRTRKRDMRKLWIARINAAARLNGMPYGRFMHGLSQAGIAVDRKMLADLAVREPEAFAQLVEVAKQQA